MSLEVARLCDVCHRDEVSDTHQLDFASTHTGYYPTSLRLLHSQAAWEGGIWCRLADEELQSELLENWSSATASLALGDGYFVVNCGGTAWWWCVPEELSELAQSRQGWLDYVALGPSDYYFVQFSDGSWRCSGPASLLKALNRAAADLRAVELLAFGPGDGWFVQYEDGASEWKGLPLDLHNKLNGRKKSLAGVEDLAVGPNGEWFVRFLDGTWRASALDYQCAQALHELEAEGRHITSVRFGEDWSWAICYAG